jgi:hypothetical protein
VRKLLSWLFSRRVVIFWLIFSTIYDAIFTYVILKLYGGLDAHQFEMNKLLSYLILCCGLEWTLLAILPLIMTLVILLAHRFWNFRPFRYYVYFLFCARIALFFYNGFLIYQIVAT